MPPLQPNNWIVIPKPNRSAKIKLFCLPFAGGNTSAFRTWGHHLPDYIEVNAVEIPGRGHRLAEPLTTVMEHLVFGIAKGIREQIDRPFALFGHSMGALVGFELAHYLKEHFNTDAAHLFFSGHGAPDTLSPKKPMYNLPEAEFLEIIKSYNGMPKEVLDHIELMHLMIPVLRSDFQICETYTYHRHRKNLDSPLTIFAGLDDRWSPKTDLEAWQKHSSGPFNLRMFPGDHFYFDNSKSLVLEAIAKDLSNSIHKKTFQGV